MKTNPLKLALQYALIISGVVIVMIIGINYAKHKCNCDEVKGRYKILKNENKVLKKENKEALKNYKDASKLNMEILNKTEHLINKKYESDTIFNNNRQWIDSLRARHRVRYVRPRYHLYYDY